MKADVVNEVNVQGEAAEAEKLAKFKAQKKEAAARFKERKAAEKATRQKTAAEIIAELKEKNLWDNFPEKGKTFLNELATPTVTSSNGSLFKTMFGDNPQVGDSITLQTAFEKTLKGKSNIDYYVTKRWAPKGIVVEFETDSANLFASKYIIKALPDNATAAADAAEE